MSTEYGETSGYTAAEEPSWDYGSILDRVETGASDQEIDVPLFESLLATSDTVDTAVPLQLWVESVPNRLSFKPRKEYQEDLTGMEAYKEFSDIADREWGVESVNAKVDETADGIEYTATVTFRKQPDGEQPPVSCRAEYGGMLYKTTDTGAADTADTADQENPATIEQVNALLDASDTVEAGMANPYGNIYRPLPLYVLDPGLAGTMHPLREGDRKTQKRFEGEELSAYMDHITETYETDRVDINLKHGGRSPSYTAFFTITHAEENVNKRIGIDGRLGGFRTTEEAETFLADAGLGPLLEDAEG